MKVKIRIDSIYFFDKIFLNEKQFKQEKKKKKIKEIESTFQIFHTFKRNTTFILSIKTVIRCLKGVNHPKRTQKKKIQIVMNAKS